MLQYLRNFALTFFLILLISGSVSYLLDPFGFFRVNNLRTSAWLGNRVWGDSRISKALVLPGLQPDTLLLGTSRVKRGFDVSDPDLQGYIGNAYNLGFGGATPDEIDKFIRYAIKYHVPSDIVIGLDFSRFIIADQAIIPGFMQHDDSFPGRIAGVMHRLSFALWSKVALMTAADVALKTNPNYLNGTKNMGVNKRRLKRLGIRAQSQVLERLSAVELRRNINRSAEKLSMDILNQSIDYACNKNIRIKLFISPLHVRQLLLLNAVGLQKRFFSWERALTEIAEKHQLNGCEISLVDFSRVSKFTSDPLPSIGDVTTSPRWYWESSHYKAALGKLIIYRLWGSDSVPRDFGVDLNRKTIDRAIKLSKEELIQYQITHPKLVKELQDIVLESGR